MTRIAIAMLALCWAVMGCGAAEDYDDATDDGAELGTVEQAFTAPAAYGYELDTSQGLPRCIAPWTNGKCFIPLQKANKFKQLCTGCDVDQTAGFLSGISQWKSVANSHGFTITDATSGQAQNILVVAEAVAGANQQTIVTFSNSLDDKSSVDGTYKRWNSCESHIDFPQIKQRIADGFYGSSCKTTSQCKQIVYANWIKNSLGHCLGLGATLGTATLMGSSPDMPVSPQTYTAAELTMLQNYVP